MVVANNNFGIPVRSGTPMAFGQMTLQSFPVDQGTVLETPFTVQNYGQLVVPLPNAAIQPPTVTADNGYEEVLSAREPETPAPRTPVPPYQPINPPVSSPDSLNIGTRTIRDGSYRIATTAGISSLRPEIIATMDFNSLYGQLGTEFSGTGKLASLNFQARLIRKNSLDSMVSALAQTQPGTQVLGRIGQTRRNTQDEITRSLSFLSDNIRQVNNVKKALDIKYLPRSHYNTERYLTLEQFFERQMKYSRRAYAAFSDTKVLYQLLFDLRSAIERYSLTLLGSSDSDRGDSDTDPVRVDKTYADASTFSFTARGLSGKLPFLENDLDSLAASLPANLDDRIKLTVITLSKELRVSSVLARNQTVIDRLNTAFSAFVGGDSSVGNVFDNVIGEAAADIFEEPQGPNSLCSLLRLTAGSATVLPFERKTVDDGQTTFIPGTKFFADQILQLQNGRFNTEPLEEYTQQFSAVVGDASFVINELFQLLNDDRRDPVLVPDTLFRRAAHFVNRHASADQQNGRVQPTMLAVFSLAAENRLIKLLLFQFFLLTGLATHTPALIPQLNRDFAQELGRLRGLSMVAPRLDAFTDPDLLQGNESLGTYLTGLADNLALTIFNISSQFQSGTTSDDRLVISSAAELSTILQHAVRLESEGSLITDLWNFIYAMDRAAGVNGTVSYFQLGSTSTRYNRLTVSSIAALSFELFAALCSKFFEANFLRSGSGVSVVVNPLKNSFSAKMISALSDRLGLDVSPANNLSFSLVSSLFSNPEESVDSVRARIVGLVSATGNTAQQTTTPGERVGDAGGAVVGRTSTGDVAALQLENIDSLVSTLGVGFDSDEGRALIRDFLLNPTVYAELASLRDNLHSIQGSLANEDTFVRNALHILNVIGDNLTLVKDQTVAYFGNGSTDVQQDLLQEANVKTSRAILDVNTRAQTRQAGLSVRVVEPGDWNLVQTTLKDEQFGAPRLKLLVVGVPMGMTDRLLDHTTTRNLSQFEDRTDVDLVKIKVWRKDLETELVFHPKEFVFDLSLYSEPATGGVGTSLESVLGRLSVRDYAEQPSVVLTLENVHNSEKWRELGTDGRKRLFKNHQTSTALSNYLFLATGLRVTEDVFPVTPYNSDLFTTAADPEETREFVAAYLRHVKNLSQEQIARLQNLDFTDRTVPTSVKEEIRTLRSADSLKLALLRQKVLSAKKFERVFVVPVDVDSFVVDSDSTRSTPGGATALANFRPQTRSVALDELFVTVETAR